MVIYSRLHLMFNIDTRTLPSACSTIVTCKITTKQIGLSKMASNWLIAEQRKDSDVVNIVNT